MNKHYDLVIIGGGIQGAGVALLARQAGYSVLLVEKNYWASATSSKSSKLVHGGLRYLQTGQFKLVYECLREREWMLKKYADLVTLNWFYIPVYKSSRYKPWKLFIGLWLYRLLAGNTTSSQFRRVDKKEWPQLSGLKQEELIAVYAYQDAQTDDAELTRTVIGEAQTAGADCYQKTVLINTKKVSLEPSDSCGYEMLLQQENQHPFTVTTSTIINATGPWVNHTLQSIIPSPSKRIDIDLVQGSHMIVSPQLSEDCFYMEAPQDGRAIFCLPWKGKSLIGTTELPHNDKPETAQVSVDEINYLQGVITHYFPNYQYTVEDTFCGLRVLPQSDKKAFLRKRDTIITKEQSVISLYGGKLTAWRATAEKVLKHIEKC